MKIQGEVPVKIDNDKYIDFLCHAADLVIKELEINGSTVDGQPITAYKHLDDGSTEYYPWAQEMFNGYYDELEGFLNEILGVYPDIKLVDGYKPVTSNKPWGETCGGKYNKE